MEANNDRLGWRTRQEGQKENRQKEIGASQKEEGGAKEKEDHRLAWPAGYRLGWREKVVALNPVQIRRASSPVARYRS
jgi:hypothetical protein